MFTGKAVVRPSLQPSSRPTASANARCASLLPVRDTDLACCTSAVQPANLLPALAPVPSHTRHRRRPFSRSAP
ncbi:hypothetical protein E2562_032322 [Oryza meyeriana var. granulata]|uniref:Uncharacterized protein n=1 Tax=Oryza meyeriana var. granulata TaxID=110450 RepID=A0A6G1E562_9ORYZ|nr:hypothetical protein E2562_032322 [Oryza meyeriana var. granulata]